MENIQHNLKFGTIEEILNGKGQEVDNYEDLYCSSKNKSIIIPKVVGVYQTKNKIPGDTEDQFEKISDFVFDMGFVMYYDTEEEIDSSLISMVYDPDVMNKDLMKMCLNKDISKRVTYFDYKNVPNFENKKINYKEEINKENNKEIDVIKNIMNISEEMRKKYGLTKEEELIRISSKEAYEILQEEEGI